MADYSIILATHHNKLNNMKSMWKKVRIPSAAVGALLLMGACASKAPTPESKSAPEDSQAALTCTLPTNCVQSQEGSSFEPLRYEGNPEHALTVLRATLAEFPEASVVNSDDLSIEVVFTTALGFRDLVDFRIDVSEQRISYRSRSSFGLFDFGKNRSRMSAFSAKFEQNAKR